MPEPRDLGYRFPVQHDFSGEVLGGRYHLDRRIGCGGMATIYAATDQTTKGVVAIKVLHPEHDKDPDLVRRFTQEGQLAAQIRHPNIVAAHDLGWVGGHHYIVMQLVPGERMSAAIKGKPLAWRQTVRLVLDVLAALAALHARGVAHRDVSPHNCLIESMEDGARVHLLDLGNARVIEETDLVVPEIEESKSLIVWGTSRYIDPDRLRGGPGDYRADIFSVGALWYAMLTGKDLPSPAEVEPIAMLEKVPLPRRLLAVLRGALDTRDRRHHSASSMIEAIKVAMKQQTRRQQAGRAWWLVPAIGLAFPAWLAGLHAAPESVAAPVIAAPHACVGAEDSPARSAVRLASVSMPDAPTVAAPPPILVVEPESMPDAAPTSISVEAPAGPLAAVDAKRNPRRFSLRAALAECKTHPTARLTIEYSPGQPIKINGARPLGHVGRCVEDVLEAHPPRKAVTMTP